MWIPLHSLEHPPPVRVVFSPYDHGTVQDMLRRVIQDFGRPGPKWQFRFRESEPGVPTDVWHVDFYFTDPRDALIFALKYRT